MLSLPHAASAAAKARPAVTADAVPDAAPTLFAERGHHGRPPVYARAWAGPDMSARGDPAIF